MAHPHFLVRTIYLPRFLGFALAVMLTIFLRGESLKSDALVVGLLLVLLAYPHLMYLISLRVFNSEAGARFSMLFDSVLVGLLIAANHFYLYATVAYVSFLMVSVAVIAGPVLVLANLMLTGTVALVCWWLYPSLLLEAPRQVEIGFAVALLVYPGFVAWQVFTVTRALGIARRHERQDKRILQTTTERLKRYISPQLFKTLLDASGERVTRRRKLTVCFTDLTGFTALMDSLPEDTITQVLNEYLNAMAEIAIGHGGTVDKFMGDGLMIFFGDPETRGPREDALACVRMAMSMRGRLASMSREWRQAGIANQLKVRVGIHTGYCAVGNFGSEHRMDYTAVGGTVNIASRLEGCASANDILMSESTALLIKDSINFEQLEKAQLKGIRRPVEIFRVLGERRGPYLENLKEQVPGLSVEVLPAELDIVAAKALLHHCLSMVEQQQKGQPGPKGIIRLLR